MLDRQYLLIIVSFITVYFSIELALKAQEKEYIETEMNQSILDTLSKYALLYPDNSQLALAVVENDKVSFAGVLKVNGGLTVINNKDSVFEVGLNIPVKVYNESGVKCTI